VSIELLARRGNETELRPLADGGHLHSRVDEYLLLVSPATTGSLYVFQIDSTGSVTWLFPWNETSPHSSGSNPVASENLLRIPGEERVLFLDDRTGVEHIVAVFANTRWYALERQLAAAAQAADRTASELPPLGGLTRGVGGTRPSRTHFPTVLNIKREQTDELLNLSLSRQSVAEYEANGSVMVISRWFHHD
jgi:hypothetical protein